MIGKARMQSNPTKIVENCFLSGKQLLVNLLHYRAQYQPNKQAYIFLQDGETESGTLTYGELDRQARAIAHSSEWLQHNLLKCFYR